jgi:hypothetical protein
MLRNTSFDFLLLLKNIKIRKFYGLIQGRAGHDTAPGMTPRRA